MSVYECDICGHLYNELDGEPAQGISSKTQWSELPDDWVCPDCGAGKSHFSLIED